MPRARTTAASRACARPRREGPKPERGPAPCASDYGGQLAQRAHRLDSGGDLALTLNEDRPQADRASALDVVLDRIADVDGIGGPAAGELEGGLEDGGGRLGLPDDRRGDGAVEQAAESSAPEPLGQGAVPVADDHHAHSARPQ